MANPALATILTVALRAQRLLQVKTGIQANEAWDTALAPASDVYGDGVAGWIIGGPMNGLRSSLMQCWILVFERGGRWLQNAVWQSRHQAGSSVDAPTQRDMRAHLPPPNRSPPGIPIGTMAEAAREPLPPRGTKATQLRPPITVVIPLLVVTPSAFTPASRHQY